MGSIEKASVREAVQEKVGWADVCVIVPVLGEREGRGDLQLSSGGVPPTDLLKVVIKHHSR